LLRAALVVFDAAAVEATVLGVWGAGAEVREQVLAACGRAGFLGGTADGSIGRLYWVGDADLRLGTGECLGRCDGGAGSRL
jgi:hypothetical protein